MELSDSIKIYKNDIIDLITGKLAFNPNACYIFDNCQSFYNLIEIFLERQKPRICIIIDNYNNNKIPNSSIYDTISFNPKIICNEDTKDNIKKGETHCFLNIYTLKTEHNKLNIEFFKELALKPITNLEVDFFNIQCEQKKMPECCKMLTDKQAILLYKDFVKFSIFSVPLFLKTAYL